jgi:hypothetical protein
MQKKSKIHILNKALSPERFDSKSSTHILALSPSKDGLETNVNSPLNILRFVIFVWSIVSFAVRMNSEGSSSTCSQINSWVTWNTFSKTLDPMYSGEKSGKVCNVIMFGRNLDWNTNVWSLVFNVQGLETHVFIVCMMRPGLTEFNSFLMITWSSVTCRPSL